MGVASRPSLLMALATSAHFSVLRLERTTLAPARANASAIARPMPLDEPVTTATLSVRSNSPLDILGDQGPFEEVKMVPPARFQRATFRLGVGLRTVYAAASLGKHHTQFVLHAEQRTQDV